MTAPSLPTFIGIGPGKSGSTWLYETLKSHPEICVSTAKETLFFESEYERGVDWYRKFFRGCEGALAVGEVSNTYIFSEVAPGRIARFRSDMRLLSILRNPIDRAFSHYLFLVRNGSEQGSFEDVLLRRPDLVTRGEYGRHVSRYLEHFDRDQMLLLIFDDWKKDPTATLPAIFGHVGVDPTFVPAAAGQRVLGATTHRSRALSRTVKGAATWVRGLGFPEVVTWIKRSPVPKLIYRAIPRDGYPEVAAETRKRLAERLGPDVEKLEGILGRDLSSTWLSSRGDR